MRLRKQKKRGFVSRLNKLSVSEMKKRKKRDSDWKMRQKLSGNDFLKKLRRKDFKLRLRKKKKRGFVLRLRQKLSANDSLMKLKRKEYV